MEQTVYVPLHMCVEKLADWSNECIFYRQLSPMSKIQLEIILFEHIWRLTIFIPSTNKVRGYIWITLSVRLSIFKVRGHIWITLSVRLSIFLWQLLRNRWTDTDKTLHSCSIQVEDLHEEGKPRSEIFQGR